jgi:hypothetical protein
MARIIEQVATSAIEHLIKETPKKSGETSPEPPRVEVQVRIYLTSFKTSFEVFGKVRKGDCQE